MRLLKDVYGSDISSLRDKIRANGTQPHLEIVNISHPKTNKTVNFYINLAYQPNANANPTSISASLYTVAFANSNGIWHFKLGTIGVHLPGNEIPGALTGDYGSLGYSHDLPNITDENLLTALNNVSDYTGAAPVTTPVLHGLTRLIIAVNEAIRFLEVENGISSVLNNTRNYQPPCDTIHNWGGNVLSKGPVKK